MQKHAYGGRACMACGGKACNISYEALRDMVEKRQLGEGGIKEGMEEPLGYAKGGKVKNHHERGVHQPESSRNPGVSDAGRWIRGADEPREEDLIGRAHHGNKLAELKSMKKPHGNFADGGPVDAKPSPKPVAVGSAEDSRIDPDKRKTVADSLMKGFGNYAEGGDVEDAPMDNDDDMLMDHCVGEAMEAIKSGDKAAFKDAMHTMMADFMGKMGKED